MIVRAAIVLLAAPAALAAQTTAEAVSQARDTGTSGLWMLANISYAGMRAQDHPSTGWRILSFIVGFPGTLLTHFVVDEGEGRAYGIDLPRRVRPEFRHDRSGEDAR